MVRAMCGALPPEARTHRRFCNSRCCSLHRYEVERLSRAQARQGRSCPVCNTAIDDARPLHAKFCSELCRGRAKNEWHRRRRIKTCCRCGGQFHAHQDSQRFCSSRCAKPKPPPRRCEFCEAAFTPRGSQRFCSVSCARKGQWAMGLALPDRRMRLSAKRFDAMFCSRAFPRCSPENYSK